MLGDCALLLNLILYSVRPGDAYMHHCTGQSLYLKQWLVACSAPNPYQKQWWIIVRSLWTNIGVSRNKVLKFVSQNVKNPPVILRSFRQSPTANHLGVYTSWLSQASWWRYQMETFSTWIALCEGKSLVTGGYPLPRPVTRSFDVFFDLRLSKWLSKQSRCRWFHTPSRSLCRHYNDICARRPPSDNGLLSLVWREAINLFCCIINWSPMGDWGTKCSPW